LEQVVAICDAGEFDGLDGASGVFRHGRESRSGLSGLRFLSR
jgi:hypothetical protein